MNKIMAFGKGIEPSARICYGQGGCKIGIAFILMFFIGTLFLVQSDVTWLQLVVSLGFIYLCPSTVLAHWLYLLGAVVVLALAYVMFMKKYYHLHEEYLASLK